MLTKIYSMAVFEYDLKFLDELNKFSLLFKSGFLELHLISD